MPLIDALRDLLWERDGGLCGICGQPVDRQAMEIDHITPRWRGGPDRIENLRPAHRVCNRTHPDAHRRGPDHPNWKGGGTPVWIKLPMDVANDIVALGASKGRSAEAQMIAMLEEWVDEQDALAGIDS
jgi:hypothetical protein